MNAGVLFPLPQGLISDFEITLTAQQVADLKNGLLYVNVNTTNFLTGEIRGQCQTSPTASAIVLNASEVGVNEGEKTVKIAVKRLGDTTSAATVSYETSDDAGFNGCDVAAGKASSRCDYIAAFGTLNFQPGETSKEITISLVDDSYLEGPEKLSLRLQNPNGANLGAPTIAIITINDNDAVPGAHPLVDDSFFVRQHYLDFLNREPDPPGFGFWTNEFVPCGADTACIEVKRINVSAAFYLSIEFQQTGYLVYRIYKAAYGNMQDAPVPLSLSEFLPDTQAIGRGVVVGVGDWQKHLDDNKKAFTDEFVTRERFTEKHSSSSATEFVNALNTNTGGILLQSERDELIEALMSGEKTRAQVLREVAEHPGFEQQEFNRAFVLMQYFGYLRRSPNSAPDTNFDGYNFWLSKLNQFSGNFVNAEMVKAFIVSGEYRQRFGP